ncbi:MAG TPA: Gfo/Idh/MocA family oxidoreductase [Cyclobacteriaceae bacterium]|nr:Gfo/Idh/MocA family oxidoreductase [Cyclobacteriaceae bacterium]
MQKVKAALLSFGMSGRVFHAPFISLHPGFELAGAWERSKKDIENHYPSAKSYTSFESLLEDSSVDLVVVNTPTYTHFDYAKKSLLANKHVVVEKAFTTTVVEAKELKALAEEKGKMLSVFQNRRWDSDFKTVQHVIKEGILGDLKEVSFSYDRFNPVLSPKLHKETPGPGAGVVYDLAPHIMDQALILFGMPTHVFADIHVMRQTSQVEDYFEILLYYPAMRVRLRATYFAREPVPSYIVHGSKGSFLKTRADVQEAMLQLGKKPVGPDWGKEPESEQGLLHTEVDGKIIRESVKTLQGNYLDYYDGVYKAIANSQKPPVTADEGVLVMRIIEAAFKSYREKKVIDFNN